MVFGLGQKNTAGQDSNVGRDAAIGATGGGLAGHPGGRK
jgi:hypothetical protein